jgi:hypothetical protein
VNRVLQRLRADHMITLRDKRLVILDLERLAALNGFKSNYLHLAEQGGVPEPSC